MIWLAVGAGGAIGSIARHEVNVFFSHVLERAVPYATAAVNLLGSLAIGLLAGLIATGRVHMSTELRTFVFVGITIWPLVTIGAAGLLGMYPQIDPSAATG